MKTEVFFI